MNDQNSIIAQKNKKTNYEAPSEYVDLKFMNFKFLFQIRRVCLDGK